MKESCPGLRFVFQSIETKKLTLGFELYNYVSLLVLNSVIITQLSASRVKTSMVNLLLSLNVLLESDHYFLPQVLQRYETFYRTILGKRRISISLRDSLRQTFLEKPTVTWFKSSEVLLFSKFISFFISCLFLAMLWNCL